MRHISAAMATQHPDNAAKPYWHSKPFLSTAAELTECFRCFSDVGIDEYNWDWEGKFVDEAVVDRLLHKHLSYFRDNPMGKNKFLTFRLPNPRVEKQFRLARAFMVIVTSSQLAKSLGFSHPPIFETILPLTETAQEILNLQSAYRQLVAIDHELLKMNNSLSHIEIIPLFEQVETIINAHVVLREYFHLHKQSFTTLPDYVRPYCARSDPAINSGIIPTVLSIVLALSSFSELEKESGVSLYPMIGTGSLPFRGGLTPYTVPETVAQYAGMRTFTVQSAFRYDFPKSDVKAAIEMLSKIAPAKTPVHVSAKDRETLVSTIPFFEKPYRATVESIAGRINDISSQVPKRRERMQHIGLFGYSRGIGAVRLPRAIPFTASLYALGVPPELIGTGRGMRKAKKTGAWECVSQYYRNCEEEITRAGHFLNKHLLESLARRHPGWKDIKDDIAGIEKTLGVTLGPSTDAHREHASIAEHVYKRLQKNQFLGDLIGRGAVLRGSLG